MKISKKLRALLVSEGKITDEEIASIQIQVDKVKRIPIIYYLHVAPKTDDDRKKMAMQILDEVLDEDVVGIVCPDWLRIEYIEDESEVHS